MSLRKVTLSLVLMFAAASLAAPSFVHAMGNDSSLVTFNQPVEIPGLVLPAGTYLFQSTGPVVQVWDAEREKLFATLMTVPAYRQDANDKPEFELEERAAGAPKAVGAWYYQGGSMGQEFVYPETLRAPDPPRPSTRFWADPATRWWVQ
jgi:hypothetical protein